MMAKNSELKRIADHKDGAWKELDPMAKALDLLRQEDFRRYALKTDLAHIHSFTHGGSQAIARNISPLGIVGSFQDQEEAAKVIRKSSLWLANAGISLARRLRQQEAGQRLSDYANQPWT